MLVHVVVVRQSRAIVLLALVLLLAQCSTRNFSNPKVRRDKDSADLLDLLHRANALLRASEYARGQSGGALKRFLQIGSI